ncbi:MAG: protein kinase [Gemmatimonadales bacterium]|nr:protein kinase [Gemmatimonadales bacterium]
MTAAPRPCPSCGTPLPAEAHFCLNCGSATPTEPGVPPRTMPTGAFEVSKVRSALADRYKILRVLGEGGMATVYLAEDLKHKREVAVKVMRPELSQTLGAERFLREVEIAAKLSHPNILPVYDSGAADGVLYYVMPVVEGESLPARIKREKQLPVEEALRLAREVAEAMAYAHARGFVHRDIKPANILISAGHALVADFGIARAMEGDGQSITQTGLAIGTPQYMSPEQASGATDLDGRSDIYALGCVLYEMISGEPPFTGPTVQAVIMRSMTEAPRPLEQTRTSLPPAVSAVVTRALAKSPADRYANAGAMVTALVAAERDTQSGITATPVPARGGFKPWQVGVAAAVVLAVGALGVKAFGGGNDTTATATVAKRIAVLPFQHIGADEDAYLADGIVEELRGKLSRLGNVTVIASASADQYRGTAKTGPEIARELRVDQVLTGKVQWAGGAGGGRRVRVSAEMVDGKTGEITWTETFDADFTDVFAMQSQLATRVAGALGAVLGQDVTADLASRPTQNAVAYDLYLKGRAITSNAAGPMRQAAGYYAQAVALDSNFAEAWARLGGALTMAHTNGTREPELGRQAKEAVDRAMLLASGKAFAHRAMAIYMVNVERDEEAARQATMRALELEPDNPEILAASALDDYVREDYATAFAKLSRARELDPRSVLILRNLIYALTFLGRANEAVQFSDELMALAPESPNVIQAIVVAHLGANDLEGARRVVRDALTRIPATELVAYFAGYQELAFVFDQPELDLLFRLTPAAFDGDRAWWGQALAIAAHQQGDMVRARAYADSSLAESKRQVDAAPNDPQLRALYAVMLAYAGKTQDALREADRAVADAPPANNNDVPYARVQRTRVLLAAGRTDQALDAIEELMGFQYYVHPGYLRVDPMFAPLKGNPRFERLLVGGIDVPRN